MQKLQLCHTNMLQGKFSLQKLNLLFIFQVNCPGCFLYGIPVVNQLYQHFNSKISFLGISTAFEDFEYNNLENTKLLLTRKELVGETQKAMQHYGFEQYPHAIDFPVAMDKIADETFSFKEATQHICNLNPSYMHWPGSHQEDFRQKVIYYLKSLEKISLTFTLNQFKGTPSLVIFNNDHDVLWQWFGHKTFSEINSVIETLYEKYN
ncbi:hypothetical protein QQ008_11200 [Fulvivirgaceae bacterium BMA10]|uniref:Uncharacterized protein n=1 Tax=Splendidivirga corallicola TaxID=3051826 RepID=A0ABT8KMI7_9BACT|nr:hypothetical protein [Fulvivirgaceae bacterium BMA10]